MPDNTQPRNRIRKAVDADLDILVDMCLEFFKSSPYASLSEYDPTVVKETITRLSNSPNSLVLVAEVGNSLAGTLIATSYPSIFSKDYMALELIWWIGDQHRDSGLGKQLAEVYQYWAMMTGCTLVSLGSAAQMKTTDKINTDLVKQGFIPIETILMRKV